MGESSEIGSHENTYHGFIAMMKWGTLAVFLVAMGVVLLIAK